MILEISNKEYFEWEVPDQVVEVMRTNNLSYQELVDQFFDFNLQSADKVSDDYYAVINIKE